MDKASKIGLGVSLVALVVALTALALPSDDADRIAKLEARVEVLEAGRPRVVPAVDSSEEEFEAEMGVERNGRPAAASADSPEEIGEVERWERALESDPDDPELRGKLRDVIAEEQERMTEERWNRRMERRRERAEERILEFATANNLGRVETEQLAELITKEQDEIGEVFRGVRSDEMDWSDAREVVSVLREETDKAVEGTLEPEAFAAYRLMREEEANRWRGRGGNRGPGATRGSE